VDDAGMKSISRAALLVALTLAFAACSSPKQSTPSAFRHIQGNEHSVHLNYEAGRRNSLALATGMTWDAATDLMGFPSEVTPDKGEGVTLLYEWGQRVLVLHFNQDNTLSSFGWQVL
jgi:hypothetical protein